MFSNDQCSFRSVISTSLEVYDMDESLLQSAEDGLTTCAVFCDFSKAGPPNCGLRSHFVNDEKNIEKLNCEMCLRKICRFGRI